MSVNLIYQITKLRCCYYKEVKITSHQSYLTNIKKNIKKKTIKKKPLYGLNLGSSEMTDLKKMGLIQNNLDLVT